MTVRELKKILEHESDHKRIVLAFHQKHRELEFLKANEGEVVLW